MFQSYFLHPSPNYLIENAIGGLVLISTDVSLILNLLLGQQDIQTAAMNSAASQRCPACCEQGATTLTTWKKKRPN